MPLIVAGCNGMNWTQLAEDTVHRLTFVLIMMNLQVQQVSFFHQDNNSSIVQGISFMKELVHSDEQSSKSVVFPKSYVVGDSVTSYGSRDN
jgi:hypothetical protein